MKTIIKTDKCAACEQAIVLVAYGKHYKWVTDPSATRSWFCNTDPNLPLKTHEPVKS